MFRSRKWTLWLTAALLGTALAVLVVVRLVRNDAAAVRNMAQVELRALLAEHEEERLRATFEEVSKRHDRTWLCERARCNEADRVPVWDNELEPSLARDPFDDWAREPRRRR